MIPKIIHQTWKNREVPRKWRPLVDRVQALNPDWEYRLWTDVDNDAFVKEEFPGFYPVFRDLSHNIMRADVIRYLLLYRIGGGVPRPGLRGAATLRLRSSQGCIAPLPEQGRRE